MSYLVVILQHLCDYSDFWMIVLDWNNPRGMKAGWQIESPTPRLVIFNLISGFDGSSTSWCWRHLQHQDLHNIYWQGLSRHLLTRSMCTESMKQIFYHYSPLLFLLFTFCFILDIWIKWLRKRKALALIVPSLWLDHEGWEQIPGRTLLG